MWGQVALVVRDIIPSAGKTPAATNDLFVPLIGQLTCLSFKLTWPMCLSAGRLPLHQQAKRARLLAPPPTGN